VTSNNSFIEYYSTQRMEATHYLVWKNLVLLNIQNLSFKHSNYPHYYPHCVLKYNLYALQKYGVTIRKMETEHINIQSLDTIGPPPELENE